MFTALPVRMRWKLSAIVLQCTRPRPKLVELSRRRIGMQMFFLGVSLIPLPVFLGGQITPQKHKPLNYDIVNIKTTKPVVHTIIKEHQVHFVCLHHVSKKLPTYLLLCVGKYESISIKVGMHVLEETANKTVQKVPTSPITCASTTLGNLKWQIELSMQYLHVHFTESLNSYKTTGSYCLGNHWTCKSHRLYITCSKCLSPANKHEDAGTTTLTARSMNAWFSLFTRFWCVFSISRHLRRTLPAFNVKMM